MADPAVTSTFNVHGDIQVMLAATRRHARVHAGIPTPDGTMCRSCLSEIEAAAKDLRVDALWLALDDLWDQVRATRP